MEFARREFWNGIGVFVVKKRASWNPRYMVC
jgi:hypothetical protein